MSIFQRQLKALQEATDDVNIHDQVVIVSHIIYEIERSENSDKCIDEFVSINLGHTMNDVICSKMIILQPSVKLVLHLMKNDSFRGYQFLPILKNILRALIFFVRCEEIEKYQLELFDVIIMLDVLLKKFMSTNISQSHTEELQGTCICLMKFTELVLSNKLFHLTVKNIIAEIYMHSLVLSRKFQCLFKRFELVTMVANLGDDILGRYQTEYGKDGCELWLYKCLQILFRFYESLPQSTEKLNQMAIKVFENIFGKNIHFVVEQLVSTSLNLDLLILCFSILNTILWSPIVSQEFRSKLLKSLFQLNIDEMIFCCAKSSNKLRIYTTYTLKIFLTAMIFYSSNFPYDKHSILNTFLESRLSGSMIELKAHKVLRNHKSLILLYACPLLRTRLLHPLNANRALENLVIIWNQFNRQLSDDEIWNILTTFALCLNNAVLTELEYAGVQRTSEMILNRALNTVSDWQKCQRPIDKYVISFVAQFCSDIYSVNSLTLMYLSQNPSLTSYKIAQLIPTHSVLPLIMSSDYNQVENALKILQRKPLTADDMNFVVQQCFGSLKVEEIVIGAVLSLIGTHLTLISQEIAGIIYCGTIAFLETKRAKSKYTDQCYLCLMKTCVQLAKFQSKIKKFDDVRV